MNILITRPAPAGQHLCDALNLLGFKAEWIPVIDICKTPHLQDLHQALIHLHTQNMAIFASPNAVHFAFAACPENWQMPQALRFVAMGPGTQEALKSQGIQNILSPKIPPFESESLLSLPEFQNIKGKKVTLFRGNGGRQLLPDTLVQRGAELTIVEAYQRRLPRLDMTPQITGWKNNPPQIIVTTSLEGLKNLLCLFSTTLSVNDYSLSNLLESTELSWIKKIPLTVVGLRMLKFVHNLGFESLILIPSAENAAIIKILKDFRDKRA